MITSEVIKLRPKKWASTLARVKPTADPCLRPVNPPWAPGPTVHLVPQSYHAWTFKYTGKCSPRVLLYQRFMLASDVLGSIVPVMLMTVPRNAGEVQEF